LIEVADSSAGIDQSGKLPLYAENGIVETWLVDLNQQCIAVYRDPAIDGYQDMQTFRPRQSIVLLSFPEVQLSVDKILGLSSVI
jgi:Uma2 family endonuclease